MPSSTVSQSGFALLVRMGSIDLPLQNDLLIMSDQSVVCSWPTTSTLHSTVQYRAQYIVHACKVIAILSLVSQGVRHCPLSAARLQSIDWMAVTKWHRAETDLTILLVTPRISVICMMTAVPSLNESCNNWRVHWLDNPTWDHKSRARSRLAVRVATKCSTLSQLLVGDCCVYLWWVKLRDWHGNSCDELLWVVVSNYLACLSSPGTVFGLSNSSPVRS